LPVTNEIGDTGSTEYQRVTTNAPLALSKYVCGGFYTGQEKSSGVGKGAVVYVICPSTWGAVTDATTYLFRDDFMGASLNTSSTWTRTQSTAGNVEIDTNFAWCKVKGNANWGTNGARTQSTIARSAGKVFLCDVFTGNGSGATDVSGAPNLIVGWNDGAGVSYTNFAHGVDFTQSSSVRQLGVYEGGTLRGTVGSGYSLNTIYRVRITLGASNATYEIQGGTQYPAIGGTSWTTITPGTTSNSTTPLCAAVTQYEASTTYVGDVRVY
jgi:hypothetical protein